MTPLLWFLAGGCVFSLVTVVLMAMMFAAKEADEWKDDLKAWSDHGAGIGYDYRPTPGRPGPYDYREGL